MDILCRHGKARISCVFAGTGEMVSPGYSETCVQIRMFSTI